MSKLKEDINEIRDSRSIYGILLSVIFFYVIIRGMKNAILYFIPREECYIEDDNKFIRTYNKLKEMVIEEQSKLSFNKKN